LDYFFIREKVNKKERDFNGADLLVSSRKLSNKEKILKSGQEG